MPNGAEYRDIVNYQGIPVTVVQQMPGMPTSEAGRCLAG